jgi:hypothetical protein
MKKTNLSQNIFASALMVACGLILGTGCSTERVKNHAKESAARYWQDKAYPGKAFDIQVIDAEKGDGGTYRVKGLVDGESRIGTFNPDTETFSEGYYSLAHERNKRIAELEQETKYWKEKSEALDKENYKLKVQLSVNTPAPFPSAVPSGVPAKGHPEKSPE